MNEQEISLKLKLDASDIRINDESNVTVNTPVAFRCPGANISLGGNEQPIAIYSQDRLVCPYATIEIEEPFGFGETFRTLALGGSLNHYNCHCIRREKNPFDQNSCSQRYDTILEANLAGNSEEMFEAFKEELRSFIKEAEDKGDNLGKCPYFSGFPFTSKNYVRKKKY